jgi:predicted site-specific integrase-resolvase
MKISKKEAAIRLNVSERTLQRYNANGIFQPTGKAKNRPYYSEKQIKKYLLERGKNRSQEIIWLSNMHLYKVKSPQTKANIIYLYDDPRNAFESKNRNLNYILDMLIKYKIKKLKIGSVLALSNSKKFDVLKLFFKKFEVNISLIDEYKEEAVKNEER